MAPASTGPAAHQSRLPTDGERECEGALVGGRRSFSQLALGRHYGRSAPRPSEGRVSHCQEVGAAVTVSPWPTLWAGESEPSSWVGATVTVSDEILRECPSKP